MIEQRSTYNHRCILITRLDVCGNTDGRGGRHVAVSNSNIDRLLQDSEHVLGGVVIGRREELEEGMYFGFWSEPKKRIKKKTNMKKLFCFWKRNSKRTPAMATYSVGSLMLLIWGAATFGIITAFAEGFGPTTCAWGEAGGTAVPTTCTLVLW